MSISTSEKILNSAEELFAENSYDRVSIKEIAKLAGVQQGLIHYHFDSKEALFDRVIKRRVETLKGLRSIALNKLLKDNNNRPLPLLSITEAFVTPYLYLTTCAGERWRRYSKLVTRLLSSNLKILKLHFTETSSIFLNEMRRSMPNASEQAVQWGYDFMVGLTCNTFSEVDRIGILSNGLCTTDDMNDACSWMVPFIASGLKSLNSNKKANFDEYFVLFKKSLESKD